MADYALLVGINAYAEQPLGTPVNDVRALKPLLERDGSMLPLWVTKVLEGPRPDSAARVTEQRFWTALDEWLRRAGRARGQFLLYFAGHGEQAEDGEHHLLLQGEAHGDPDVRVGLREVVQRVHGNREVKSAAVIIDCCYAGGATTDPDYVVTRDRAILTSSSDDEQSADGHRRHSPFAERLLEGLEGVAAPLDGTISLTGLYEYVAKRFGRDAQRPQLQINLADEPIVIRRVPRLIDASHLHELFPASPHDVFRLTKAHEGEPGSRPYAPGYRPTQEQVIYDRLKALQIRGLIDLGDSDSMYFVAMREPDGGDVRLSPLGRWYWHQWNLGWM